MLAKHEAKLEEIRVFLNRLSKDLVNGSKKTLEGLQNDDISSFEEVRISIKNSSALGNEIDNEIITSLALFGAEATDLRELVAFLKITNELVRISDNLRSFCKKITNLINNGECFLNCKEHASSLCKSASKALEFSSNAINTKDEESLRNIYTKVQIEESKTDDLYAILEKNILSDLCQMGDFSSEYIDILRTMRKLEKIADRAVNIVKLVQYAKIGGKMELH